MSSVRVAASLVLVIGLGGCTKLFFPSESSKGLTGQDADGGVCTKDEQTIKNVMLAPPACNATNPCPCGTFCSSQTGGNCVADCVDDTWCAPGYSCSPFGQCLKAGADGGASDAASVDPSCPRNTTLLDGLKAMNRSCQFDDGCPFGSFCNHAKEVCDFDCRTDGDCASLNTAGQTFVCGCLGQCVAVAAPRTPPTQVLPTLEVTPAQFGFPRPATITAPDWGPTNTRTIQAVIVAPFLTGPAGSQIGPPVTLQAIPGPGLLVACPGSPTPTGNACSFQIDQTQYTKKGDVYRSAPVLFTVSASTDPSFATTTTWTLRFESKDIGNAPQAVPLRYFDQVNVTAPAAPVPVSAPDPSFTGQGRIEMTSPTGMPMRLNVKARAFGGNLVLFDETQQLSPSGKLVLIPASSGQGTQYAQTFVNPEQGNDVSLQATFTGRSAQKVVSFNLLQDPSGGGLSGSFDRVVYTDNPFSVLDPSSPFERQFTTTFALVPSSPSSIGACSSNGDCGSGSCDLGFCSTLPAHQFYGVVFSSTQADYFTHLRMTRWGGHWPGNDNSPTNHPMGFWGLYVPSSFYTATVAGFRSGYTLHGPVPLISGEPLADLFDGFGNPLLQNQHQIAVPLLTQHDGTFTSTAASLLQNCLSDLARDRQNPQPSALPGNDPDVFDTFTSCINLGRLTWVMSDHTTYQRGLQAWLEVHSFVLREGLEEIQAAAANGGIPGNSNPTATPPTLEQILAVGESGLGFLIDSMRFGSYYPVNDAATISSEVDYRAANLSQSCNPTSNPNNKDQDCNGGDGAVTLSCDPNTDSCKLLTLNELPQHEQPIGVPTYILEATASYLKVLDAYMQKIARQTYGQPADANPANSRQTALSRFGSGMRLAWFAEELAVDINNKAPCQAGNPNCGVITKRFNAARDEMNSLRAHAISGADALQNARNPFNIPEDDVPLFFGDPTGTSSQYFAASDYLLDGWAAPAVNQAAAALDAARAAWIQREQSAVQDELNQHNRQQEIDNLMSKYGSPVLANCGNLQVPDGQGGVKLLGSTDVVPYFAAHPERFSNENCFIDQTCIGTVQSLDERIAIQTVINNAFMDLSPNGHLGLKVEPGSVTGRDLATDFIVSELCKISYFKKEMPNEKFANYLNSICPGNSLPNEGDCFAATFTTSPDKNIYLWTSDFNTLVPLAAFYGPIARADVGKNQDPNAFYLFATDGPGPDNDVYNFHDYRSDNNRIVPTNTVILGSGVVVTSVADAMDSLAANACNDTRREKEDHPRPAPDAFPAQCYKGSMGVAWQEVQSDLLKIQRAKEVLDSGQKDLEDQKNLCKSIDTHAAMISSLEGNYAQMKQDYELVSDFADAGQKGFSAGMSSGNPYVGIAVGVVSFALDLFGSSVSDEATQLQQMEQDFSEDEKSQQCWNTFRAQRNAMATAMTDIQIAATEMNAETVRYANLKDENTLNLQEGQAAYQRELDSPVGSLSHTFWVDERIQSFKETFEWARRLTFVAMRSVEYEFQQSLPYRSAIVSAETAADLQSVIIGLKQEQVSRTINRRRPDEASVVLSLRDDVLSIGDNSAAPAGERNWTAAQRFESRLYDSRFAWRDSKGNYLGQAIPFDLKPTGVLETRCGERLWRATATIQGDGIDQSAPGASILLLKRNTFQSQYCAGKAPQAPDGSVPQMQVGVTHTSADLFQPGSQVDLSDASEFTAALLYPWFNIARTEFYKTTYQDGASQELAGRGLYGDYVLLFPKQVLDDGFALDKVEDVLLRLDYLSVDNLSQ
jgi:hypothetical protein